ncbi:Retrovirus-related Pol polyprotein from transposon TNT 1-94 [Vitis vinifera]|uniref:Retrovirus-related Pol polyprotein from transposon TNT 1-94 n=1 Tax=Vitis vinifera TaxID=29760 RepID=A0A438GQF5_VITVI|nr:Retrovirus-related Pol polyprotein from transposon TNT 1-94 [Vitis vinifera]
MGNASSSMVKGKGDVVLNLTSGKKLTLMDVLFVPEIRKNLVSASLLSKKGFKLVFKSDKFVLTKGGTFVGKGYMSEGLFKLNVFNDNVIASTINKSFMSSTYIVESCELWHSRLGHVNYRSIKDENIDVFKTYKNEVENQKNKTLKMLRSDRGGEYEFTTLSEFCALHDDMLIMGTNKNIINSTKKILRSKFDMKDLGLTYVILGIRVKKNHEGYVLIQSHCVESVLKRFGHYDSKPCATPFDPNYKLKKNMGDSVSQLEYSRVIGSLMYITNCTRPDIAYSINRLARYTNNLAKEHWFAFVRVLRYFKHTIKYGLHYIRYPSVIEGFSDANWISDSLESKSTSEYIFNLGGAAISWKSSKQTCIARSTMESEFIALDNAGEEAEWLRNFLEDIPIWLKPVTPICIHCDSQKALARAKNAVYNGKSRHIRRRHNTIKQLLSNGVITTDFVKLKDNIADPLTKGLSREQVIVTTRGMGLKPIK